MALSPSLQAVQQRLLDNDYDLGPSGADGYWGSDTADALHRMMDKAGLKSANALDEAAATVSRIDAMAGTMAVENGIPSLWLPDAVMKRIIVHWTAGSYVCSELDLEHYHIIIDGENQLHKGEHSIKDNEVIHGTDYAAHTLNCNSGAIGVSVACMAGAIETPFSAGAFPMKVGQFNKLAAVVAQLCSRYKIPILPTTVLSHAEVQNTLGIKQRGKWDIARLPFDQSVVGAAAVGNRFRSLVSQFKIGG